MQDLRVVLLYPVVLAACAVEPDDVATSTATFVGETQASRHDFTCLGQPLPGSASDVVTVRGITNDSYAYTGLPDVALDLLDKSGILLDATSSDVGGAVELTVAARGEP